jgi:hypothetical protein
MDLFILVADKNIHFALEGALARPEAIGIRAISHQIRVHSGRDGGCRTTGVDILALERNLHDAFLLVFDFEGCGAECDADELERELDAHLQERVGPKSKAIVVVPEADIWVWGSDNVLSEIFEWPLDTGIRDWLIEREFEFNDQGKPLRPKEALEALLTIHRKPRSSALYKRITSRISLARCSDSAYDRTRQALLDWFPPVSAQE